MINANDIKNNPQFNSINPSKFQIVQGRTNIHDKAPETKPVSYFKDAWNRFKKNKGSVVATVIIAILVLFAIFGPIFSPYTVAYSDAYFKFCLPKSNMSEVFGWDFWDGCKEDIMNGPKFRYYHSIGEESVRVAGENAHPVIKNQEYEILEYNENGKPISYKVRFDTYTQYGCVYLNLTEEEYASIQQYQDEYKVQVIYPITQYDLRPNSYDGAINDANYWMQTENVKGKATILTDENGNYTPIYQGFQGINKKGVAFDGYTSEMYEVKTDGNENPYYYVETNKGWKVIDSEGNFYNINVDLVYADKDIYYTDADGSCKLDIIENPAGIEIIKDEDGNENKLPLRKYNYGRKNQTGYEVRVNYYEYYCYLHKYVLKDGIEKPLFLFGSSDFGHDIFTQLAGGARFSFLFAIAVSVVNMLVGTIYGAIEGYYGGAADIIMERICDILGSVPTMIVITLLKMHMRGTAMQEHGHLLILFITYFATGWMGMAGRVRMQFYRFKNQEYVLASRTLGARDRRIMFKHIFPNSLGTIVTGSVLVIPGMIFSESSLSYLGIINLSTGDLTSVGTLLAKADPYLADYPYMMVFPAVFISLLMLSFNLFGNGLRDAFNPSLRGAEE